MTFQEKSIVGSLVILILTFGFYSAIIVPMMFLDNPHVGAVFGMLMVVTVVLIILEVIYHILIGIPAAIRRETETDERDRMIALKSLPLADFLHGAATFSAIGVLVLAPMFGRSETWAIFIGVNVLIFGLAVSQVVQYLNQLLLYRRGVV